MTMKPLVASGEMRTPFELQQSSGSGASQTWTTIKRLFGKLSVKTGADAIKAREIFGKPLADITLWYDPAVTPLMRLKTGNRIFDIDSAVNVDDRYAQLAILGLENLAVTLGLNESITILRKTITKGLNGAAEVTTTVYATGVQARFQDISAARSEQHGRQSGEIHVKFFMMLQYQLDNSYRIQRPDGTVWEVIGFEGPDPNTNLTVINAMRRI